MHKASGPDRPRLVAFRAVEPMCGCAARLQICLWQMLALQASRCPQSGLWLRPGAVRLHIGVADVSLRRKAADLPSANAGLTGQPLPAAWLVASARRCAPSHRLCRYEPAPQGCRFAFGKCWPYRPAAARRVACGFGPALCAFTSALPMWACAARLQICLWQMLALQASCCPQRCSLVSFWSALTSLARYELRPRTDTALARGGLTARLQPAGLQLYRFFPT